jgi:hypothetical protein
LRCPSFPKMTEKGSWLFEEIVSQIEVNGER